MRHTRCGPSCIKNYGNRSKLASDYMPYVTQPTSLVLPAGDVQPLALLGDRLHKANAGLRIELVTHAAHKVCLL